MVYATSIKYPYTNLRELFIAYVLLTVPFLNFLTIFFTLGYWAKATRHSKSNVILPEFSDAAHMFVSGLKVALVVLVYALPAIFSLLLLLVNTQVATVVASLLGILAAFLLPAALISYSSEEQFSHAFNFKAIMKSTFTGSMIGAWLVAIVVGIGYFAMGVVLAFFTQIIYVGLWFSMGLALILAMFTVIPLFVSAHQKNLGQLNQ